MDIKLAGPREKLTGDLLDNLELMKKVAEKTSSSLGKLSARASYRSSAYENPGIKWNFERKSAADMKSDAVNSSLRSLDALNPMNE